jgi:hypothetical protein
MQEGQKVRMLEDFASFKKGDKVTCCRFEDDGIHYFVNKEGDKHYFGSSYYKIINETMTKREKLEKAARDIQAQIEALPKRENGWYNNDSGYIVYYDFDTNQSYGFADRLWFEGNEAEYLFCERKDRPATHKEVETALIAEAKKRGFKEGVKINRSTEMEFLFDERGVGLYGSKIIPNGKEFAFRENYLILNGKFIFIDGKWATIIEEPKVVIGGYEMKQEHQKVMFGCMEFSKSHIKALYANCKKLKVQSVMIEGTVVQIDQLKEIVENIED